MSRRLTPFLFAGFLGVVSGVYIFGPIFEEAATAQELRGAAKEGKSPVQEQDQLPTGSQQAK